MADTLLTYDFKTTPDPVQASTSETASTATLKIVASNNTDKIIVVESISFSLPVGTNAKAFLAKAGGNTTKLAGWTFAPDGTLFTAKPDTPKDGEVGAHGLDFIISGLTVNQEPGTSHLDILEMASQPRRTPPAPKDLRKLSFPVSKFPYDFTLGGLSPTPTRVKQGESTTLSWKGSAGASYVLEYDDVTINKGRDGQPLPADGSYRVDDLRNNPTFFSLIVTYKPSGASEAATLQRDTLVRVTIPPPPPIPPPSIKRFAPRGCVGSECLITATEFTLEWEIESVGPYQRQLTCKDSTKEYVIEVPWHLNSILVKPYENVTEYTMTVRNDKDPAVSSTVSVTLAPPVPIATIVSWGGWWAGNLQTGWLYCNGQEVSQKQYPDLYAILKETYGRPVTSSNFKLPDLRGYFLRGYDDARGIDPGRGAASFQEDTFRSHTHGQRVTANENNGSAIRADFSNDGSKFGEYDQGVQTHAAGDAETRPKNLACYYLIYAGIPKPLQVKPKPSPKPKAIQKGKSSAKGKAARGRSRKS